MAGFDRWRLQDFAPGERRVVGVTDDAVPLRPDMVTLGWR